MHRFTHFCIFLCAFALVSCTPEEVIISVPTQEGFSNPLDLRFDDREMTELNRELRLPREINQILVPLPKHIATQTFATQVIANSESDARKAVLGRVLFYDKALSATGETSCATCHLQENAFADPKAFSEGINGAVTKRNSIALGSVPTFAPAISGYGSSPDENSAGVDGSVKFFWDERAATIKEQSELTIQDELEMGKDLHELSSELRNRRIYQILSMKAFGTTDLTPDRITLALEKFTGTMVAMTTRFDHFRDLESTSADQLTREFTAEEIRGGRLFNRNCSSCHGFSLTQPAVAVANNGLDEVYSDKGVGDLTGDPSQNGVFKVPFLRNIALTAPYMHDGRFTTLREVIDHYSDDIASHRNLHPNLKNDDFTPRRMNFTEADKRALISFLRLTTDKTMASNSSLSNPFHR